MYSHVMKNIYLLSLFMGCISPLISYSIFLILDSVFILEGLDNSALSMVELLLALIVAPILETIVLIGLLSVLGLFLPIFWSATITLAAFSYLHYFNHWAASILTLPVFIISIILFLEWQKDDFNKAAVGVVLIHFINNLVFIMAGYYFT